MPDSVWIFILTPLAIVAILGTVAFAIGFRTVLKRQPAEEAPEVFDRKDQARPATDESPVRAQVMRKDGRVTSQA